MRMGSMAPELDEVVEASERAEGWRANCSMLSFTSRMACGRRLYVENFLVADQV